MVIMKEMVVGWISHIGSRVIWMIKDRVLMLDCQIVVMVVDWVLHDMLELMMLVVVWSIVNDLSCVSVVHNWLILNNGDLVLDWSLPVGLSVLWEVVMEEAWSHVVC